ncbi:MAG TPA: ATP-binding cassette domain-containing protein, partial [Flavitalea sp.]|nr:ATP-binding cassette domain-containing protein [Flavitalea sp.]
YSYYEAEKELRVELQQRAFENQQEFIRQQERFIERFKAKASKAAAAQSAMKRLDKIDRIEDVEIERPNIRINFRIDKVPGKILCTLKDVSKNFGDIKIVEKASAEINRGDKIALIGANGKGKSTLLRIIAGVESFQGERVWGHNVEESFYAQHQLEALDVNNTVLDEMKSAASQQTDQELRTLLGCFLFTGDDIDKKIRVLSGGEKARVALAKTIISKANFLMLDEPTNHLDMHSCDLLIEALNKYQGSLILVSHDRYFISKTANKIWEIDDQKIREFIGTYEEWVDWKERNLKEKQRLSQADSKKKEPELKQAAPARVETPKTEPPKAINKEAKKELQKQQKLFAQLEADIAALNKEKTSLEAAMASPEIYADKTSFSKTEQQYQQVSSRLAEMNKQYEVVFEKLMELEAEQ